MRTRLLAASLMLAATATGLWAVAAQDRAFPHEKHARLFPVCTGCHSGVATGDTADFYPAPGLCVRCHDGKRERVVDWTGPHRRPTNLAFSHPAHVERTAAQGLSVACESCHGLGKEPAHMAVAEATPEACIGCHAHQAPTHLAESAVCRTCHVPVASATALDTSAIAAFPRPASHKAADFLATHGSGIGAAQAGARCAVCHARQSCERCHLNAAAIPAIAALQPDSRIATLVAGKPARYPEPASHRTGDWRLAHGRGARADIATCANCHSRAGCTTCHIGGTTAGLIAALPAPRKGGPSGALAGRRYAAREPINPGSPLSDAALHGAGGARVHPVDFATTHGTAAAAGEPKCSSCHEQAFCQKCHAAPARPGFHPPDFMARHGAQAFSSQTNCSTCHNREAFCKTCHENSRIAAGATTGPFHTRQPLWLLQHGQAARQGLESCASCHKQRDCLRCHSDIGWGVNPHGPGFDADKMAARNQLVCARCHVGATPR